MAALPLSPPTLILPLMRDGDLDSDIVYHEYGHGLTWRMIGNMSGSMSGAIGEGMSDVVAFLMNNDPAVGEYSASNSIGIRTATYDVHNVTYGGFAGDFVHTDGEIYAATIWHLWKNNWTGSDDDLWDHLIGGMNYTPSGPAMEDMRDGILSYAANNGNAHECEIWQAFADKGIGVNANAKIRGPRVTITEDFTVPAYCAAGCDLSETSCTDGSDNDCDGAIDCDDSDCSSDPACDTPCDTSETSCTDGSDNDCDGAIDCDDSDCSADPACQTGSCQGFRETCDTSADCCAGLSCKTRGRWANTCG